MRQCVRIIADNVICVYMHTHADPYMDICPSHLGPSPRFGVHCCVECVRACADMVACEKSGKEYLCVRQFDALTMENGFSDGKWEVAGIWLSGIRPNGYHVDIHGGGIIRSLMIMVDEQKG